MVKVITTEGLELILENEFPCIINYKSEPESVLSYSLIQNIEGYESYLDELNVDELQVYVTSRVTPVLYSLERLELDTETKFVAKNSYDIIETEEYVINQLSDEGIKFHQYNAQYR